MQSHTIDYRIFGHDIQTVEVGLDPGETVIAEAGAMVYMDADIGFKTRLGDGTEGILGKLFAAGKRKMTGESLFLTHFTNTAGSKKTIAFAAPFPGSIVPLNLSDLGGEVICQKDAFLAAAFGTQVDITFNKRLGSGFFGGEGFILQRLRGDGLAFVHAGGTVIEKAIDGQTLYVDTGCLVAFTGGIDFGIRMNRSLKSMLFGGEGMFLATLRGRGRVWVQSLPFSRLADRILENAPALVGGGKRDE